MQPGQGRRDADGQDQVGHQLQRAATEEDEKGADVVGDPRHHAAGLLAVEVGHRQALKLPVQRVGQIAHHFEADAAHGLAHLPGEHHARQVAADRGGQNNEDSSRSGSLGECRGVVTERDQSIQHPALQEGNRHQQRRLDEHAGQRQQHGQSIALEELSFQAPQPAEGARRWSKLIGRIHPHLFPVIGDRKKSISWEACQSNCRGTNDERGGPRRKMSLPVCHGWQNFILHSSP